jgi:hypothetical protein
VQKHVKDPVAIQAIATELSGLIGTNQTNPQPDPQPVEIPAIKNASIDSSMPTLF